MDTSQLSTKVPLPPRGRARVGVLFALTAITATSAIHAHTFENPKHTHARVSANDIQIETHYTIPPGDLAHRTRTLFDSDSDGTLNETERDSLAAYLRTSALHFLKVELNGESVTLEEVSSEVRGDELETSSALELTGTWTLRATEPAYKRKNVLVLSDRHKDGALQVPVLVSVNGETHEYRLDARRPQIRLRFKRPENRMNP